MSLPIIFIHRGYSNYVFYAVSQAKSTNPGSEIFLIGDRGNSFIQNARHIDYLSYFDNASKFEPIYRPNHMSFGNYSYELFCFQRWFIIQELMHREGFSSCIHLDSDVLIYSNLTEDQKLFESYDFTLSKKGSGHNSFITRKGIDALCNLLIEYYSTPHLLDILKKIREDALKNGQTTGGICDMTLLKQFYQRFAERIGSTSDIIQDAVFDPNINGQDGFEMENGVKKIYWIDGLPYGKHLELDRLIRFKSIHFQGKAKQYMEKHLTASSLDFYPKLLYCKLQNAANKLLGKRTKLF